MTKIVELIYTEQRRGLGGDNDPVRFVQQWFTKEGTLLFEKDPCEDLKKENENA